RESGISWGLLGNVTVPASGRVTFSWDTIEGDDQPEPDEGFDVWLRGDEIDAHTAVRVVDDDGSESVRIVPASPSAGRAGSAVDVTVTNQGPVEADITLAARPTTTTTRRFEIDPPVMRLRPGSSQTARVHVLPDQTDQGTVDVTVV